MGVNTTSGVTSWNLMHIILNPRLQQRLHEELSDTVKVAGDDGHVMAKTLENARRRI
jgi:cytochrome P450